MAGFIYFPFGLCGQAPTRQPPLVHTVQKSSLWWVDQNKQQQTNDLTYKRLTDCALVRTRTDVWFLSDPESFVV